MKKTAIVISMAALLAACESTQGNMAVGAIIGGGACLLAGGSDTECLLAAGAGAAAGYILSEVLDERDRKAYEKARAEAASSYMPLETTNPETGNSFQFTPTSESENASGQTCRTFDLTYNKAGEDFPLTETYCETSPDNWELVK